MAAKNYYRTLGVGRDASGEEIKKAYRKLAMEHHPDRNQDKAGCEENLKEINEAYRVLGNQERKRQYDLLCRTPFNGNADYQENLSDDDLMTILRMFSQREFGMKGYGRCKGLGKRGCRRWKETV